MAAKGPRNPERSFGVSVGAVAAAAAIYFGWNGSSLFALREPIDCAPEDAYRCFMRTNMDVLVLENFILLKEEQTPSAQDELWKQEFVLD